MATSDFADSTFVAVHVALEVLLPLDVSVANSLLSVQTSEAFSPPDDSSACVHPGEDFSSPVARVRSSTSDACPEAPVRHAVFTFGTPLPVLHLEFFDAHNTPRTPLANRAPAARVIRRLRRRGEDSDSDAEEGSDADADIVPPPRIVRVIRVNRRLLF
jgi:hypothetical protein